MLCELLNNKTNKMTGSNENDIGLYRAEKTLIARLYGGRSNGRRIDSSRNRQSQLS